MIRFFYCLFWVSLINFCLLPQSKEVFVVLGSDTGLWDGLNCSNYVCTYGVSLYTSPDMNGYKVMDESFRNSIRDSYNHTLKYTWWLMGGNTFRYATNKNMPFVNTMVPYLMKHFHGDKVLQYGDELTLHYHDWDWTDYDHNGQYMWNQAVHFWNVKEDFDYTLATFLLEEDIFPVSFRSGWHAMDNGWQRYLNEIIPYSLHNDYPAKHIDTLPPIDNVYDWSRSSAEFVPFHPSTADYQLRGDGKGFNTRSRYMASMSQDMMNTVFNKANNGVNQVVTLWAHLPEDDFLDNTRRVDSILHVSAALYPNVKFRYCTAVEAMKLWRQSQDSIPPVVEIEEVEQGENVVYNITSSEPIFQKVPFVAAKTLDNNFSILPVVSTGTNSWQTSLPMKKSNMAKIAVAVTDTMGNQTKRFFRYVPDDIFVDNRSSDYIEQSGSWSTASNNFAWDTDYRKTSSDTASFKCNITVTQNAVYNVYLQPNEKITAPVKVKIYKDRVLTDSTVIDSMNAKDWNFITSQVFQSCRPNYITVEKTTPGGSLNFDVLKISALVPEKKLSVQNTTVEVQNAIVNDSVLVIVTAENTGRDTIRIDGTQSQKGYIKNITPLPVILKTGEKKTFSFLFFSSTLGAVSDTVILNEGNSDLLKLTFNADVKKYFKIVDNEDSSFYVERGTWAKSNAQAYGISSRYAFVTASNPANASFYCKVRDAGYYDIFQIVPNSENATTAIYRLKINNVTKDSVTLNQNTNSGNWIKLFNSYLPADTLVEINVACATTTSGSNVLRADAVKMQFIDKYSGIASEQVVKSMGLSQNYPNPFNPNTTIRCNIAVEGKYQLKIYNVLGEEITILNNGVLNRGEHSFTFNAANLPSGVYIYRLTGNNVNISKKMMLLK